MYIILWGDYATYANLHTLFAIGQLLAAVSGRRTWRVVPAAVSYRVLVINTAAVNVLTENTNLQQHSNYIHV